MNSLTLQCMFIAFKIQNKSAKCILRILRCSVICSCYRMAPLQVLVNCRGDRMESHLHFAKTTYHGIVSFYIKEFPYFRGMSVWSLALMIVWGATRVATTLRRRHLRFGLFESTHIFCVNVIYASKSSMTSTHCPSLTHVPLTFIHQWSMTAGLVLGN